MDEHPEGVEELVDAMVEGYAPISVILEHMLQSPGQPTVAEVRATLGPMLRDTLEPLATRFGSEALLTTAAVLEATVPLIHEDIHLVSHDFIEQHHPNRAARRRAARGGRRNARRA